MPSFFTTGLMAATLAGSAAAHMMIDFPPPFRSKVNPFATNIDYSMTSPLAADGSNYPCKGYHVDLGTPAGRPTASFAPGQTYNISIVGGANHGGGSCQISLSYDKGQTFTVIESIIGGCPLQQHYDFTIPPDAQSGEALLSWSWHNQIGNREMYHNCAAVTIGGGSAKKRAPAAVEARAVAYQSRPQIFVANVGNGCTVEEGAPVQYPNPGPNVIGTGAGAVPPVGNCASSSGGGGGGGGGSGDGGAAPPPAPTTEVADPPAAPTAEPVDPPAAPTTEPANPPAAPTATLPGGVFITVSTDGAAAPTDGAAAPTDGAAAPTDSPAAPTDSPAAPTDGAGGGDAPTVQPVAPTPAPEQPAPTELPPTLSESAIPIDPLPTTLQTATKPISAAPPAGTGGAGSGSGSGGGSAFPQGTTCPKEGEWNCIDGTSFQRCASGIWSAVMQMSPGTKCKAGEGDDLGLYAGKKLRVVRAVRARRW